MGLVSRLISAERERRGWRWRLADQIAQNAPVAIAAAKAAIEEAWDLTLSEGLDRERSWYERPLLSEDRLEGLKAFAERRAPNWSGK